MTRIDAPAACRRLLGAGALIALAGCVAVPVVAPVAPPPPVGAVAPVARPAPAPAAPLPGLASPYARAVIASAAPAPAPVTVPAVAPVPPAPAPAASGPRDARTGLPSAALVSVAGSPARYTVLLRPARTDSATVAAVPATLCGARGVAASRTQAPRPGSAIPGVQILVVECAGAA